ncbi:DUF932 domain-containing protein [Thalassococcus profundi]|uniref:DUF932 domain-containing protein n=1 Tax=Thalassococcus profundi TaxID=2282382 RepID=A0A369TPQ4_9RHOB|nr:DUF932 domain-containing protein [Thalassococcus profundi]RDD67253.1 DUF932 domain-containing protein [Thalassococcus profundi]
MKDGNWTWPEETVDLTPEQHRWRARDVSYYRGPWNRLKAMIPGFELAPFRLEPDAPENQHLRMVVRKPVTQTEQAIPIGTVSPSYSLASHSEVADLCFEGLKRCGVKPEEVRPELGLSELGEWMNLRLVLPERFAMQEATGQQTALRLECFNSVDGSSRLVIVFGWLRFVCANGLIIGKTMIQIRERHDGSLALEEIPDRIERAFKTADADRRRRLRLHEVQVEEKALISWVDGPVAKTWGKKAAARILYICRTGRDAEFDDPFAPGEASEKPMRQRDPVPGSAVPARNAFEIMQAMSFVATGRNDALERQRMQREVDQLLEVLKPS